MLTDCYFQIPNFVWRFDPKTRHIRAVADGIKEPNGIVFSPDGKVAYVYVTIRVLNLSTYCSAVFRQSRTDIFHRTDTSSANGRGGFDGTSGAQV